MTVTPLPLLGFVAWSGTGKTTLLERLIPLLNRRGLRLGVLKHTHHDFDIDQPGKDSYRLRKAGASQVMAASSMRHARIVETPNGEARFSDLLASFDWEILDLLLVEGFKHQHFPKIELHRGAIGRPLLFPDDPDIVALVSDTPKDTALPQFNVDDLPAIADFICARLTVPRGDDGKAPSLAAPHDARSANQGIHRQPLRLMARVMTDIPGQCTGEQPGHATQDASGTLQVEPASALLAANCLIETDPAQSTTGVGERVWIHPLP
ncbi:bifunctional molybdopterin-guanine dinucleotide biosynthesis protein MobB/MoeA [Aeromonas molluscorum 848]|uniref:Bifunctional molybdopterin-guanine dinucleotide biosynthesis protein MobB/MoeA n=1 Tax=Aeromonas molluscorum 848 TaxID=1268236 RepID=R1GT32_9GAMM|nr:bifunctional molybdopterin-guanine dinucleotide biosynthesis protein MobB/MoeA [Aeromonas molluscorum 848]